MESCDITTDDEDLYWNSQINQGTQKPVMQIRIIIIVLYLTYLYCGLNNLGVHN